MKFEDKNLDGIFKFNFLDNNRLEVSGYIYLKFQMKFNINSRTQKEFTWKFPHEKI